METIRSAEEQLESIRDNYETLLQVLSSTHHPTTNSSNNGGNVHILLPPPLVKVPTNTEPMTTITLSAAEAQTAMDALRSLQQRSEALYHQHLVKIEKQVKSHNSDATTKANDTKTINRAERLLQSFKEVKACLSEALSDSININNANHKKNEKANNSSSVDDKNDLHHEQHPSELEPAQCADGSLEPTDTSPVKDLQKPKQPEKKAKLLSAESSSSNPVNSNSPTATTAAVHPPNDHNNAKKRATPPKTSRQRLAETMKKKTKKSHTTPPTAPKPHPPGGEDNGASSLRLVDAKAAHSAPSSAPKNETPPPHRPVVHKNGCAKAVHNPEHENGHQDDGKATATHKPTTTKTTTQTKAPQDPPSKKIATNLAKSDVAPRQKISLTVGKETMEGSKVTARRDETDTPYDHSTVPSGGSDNTRATIKKRLPPLKLCYMDGIREMHRKEIFSVAWSSTDVYHQTQGSLPVQVYSYLATCGERSITLYRMELPGVSAIEGDKHIAARVKSEDGADSTTQFTVTQSYIDADTKETFFACTFGGRSRRHDKSIAPRRHQEADDDTTSDQLSNCQLDEMWEEDHRPTKKRRREAIRSLPWVNDEDREENEAIGPQLLCAGGLRGVIKILDVGRFHVVHTLTGHGDEILDLKTSPRDEWMLISASRDESVRLWNLRLGVNLVIMSGYAGHRDAVVSLAWHPSGQQIATGGMDTVIRLWGLREGTNIARAMVDSHDLAKSMPSFCVDLAFQPIREQFPVFATNKIHTHCVDCIQYIGDLMLSKSTEESVELWSPVMDYKKSPYSPDVLPNGDVIRLRTFRFNDANIWYLRFGTDARGELLAVGNIVGDIFLWEIGGKTSEPVARVKARRKSTIRSVAFSPDGGLLVASADDGSVYKWDIVR